MITKYGYSTVGIVAIAVFIIFVLGIFVHNHTSKYLLFGLGIFLTLFTLYFFRDPDRKIPNEKNIIISPADGKILVIKNVESNRFIKGNCTQVSVFMSPLNVHVNRIPIDGTVEYFEYIKGKFLTAFNDKADLENERTEIGITSPEFGKVLYTQVAGFVARRIVCNLKVGDIVNAGEKFGMIKFGSRVDIILPNNHEILVKEGDVVTAGETIISRINK